MFIILNVLLLLSLFFLVYMLGFSFSRSDQASSTYLAMLSCVLFFYNLGYLLEISATTPGEAFIALRVENLGIPLVSPFFLMTALSFFHPKLLRRWATMVVLSYGAIMFLAIFLNNHHYLYYSSIDMEFNGVFYAAILGKGPLYIVQQSISLLFMLLVYVLLAVRYVMGSNKMRSQMRMLVLGSLFGFAGNIANVTGIMPLKIDPTPIAMTIGLAFFAIGMYRHKLMQIVPAAFNMAVEGMDDAMIVLDTDWCFIYCNQKAKVVFPVLDDLSVMDDVINARGWPIELKPDAQSPLIFSTTSSITGQRILQRTTINPIINRHGICIGVSLIIEDITAITSMLNQLEEMATTDPLTGVHNRRYFATVVDKQMAVAHQRNIPMGMLMWDIDHFKHVNDTYGHRAGDYVLCQLVQAVNKQLREYDVMARFGGEEFVILSSAINESGLIAFANRLRESIECTVIEYEGTLIPVTASFGVAMIQPGQRYADIMEAVDRALYAAKNSGRNKVVLGIVEGEPCHE